MAWVINTPAIRTSRQTAAAFLVRRRNSATPLLISATPTTRRNHGGYPQCAKRLAQRSAVIPKSFDAPCATKNRPRRRTSPQASLLVEPFFVSSRALESPEISMYHISRVLPRFSPQNSSLHL